MALRLDDIKQPKRPAKAKGQPFESAPINTTFEPEVYETVMDELNGSGEKNSSSLDKLRPWQNEDHREGPRTYAAKEAVTRARERARLNEELAAKLRQGHTDELVEQRLKQARLERERFFDFQEKSIESSEKKIRVSSPFVKFFRDLLRQ